MQKAPKVNSTGKCALFTVLIFNMFDYNNKFVIVWWSASSSCLRIFGIKNSDRLTLGQGLNLFTCDICSFNNTYETSSKC